MNKYTITCDDKHIYRVNGVIKPGVSEILSGLGLINLRKIPTHHLESGRARGTEVHSVIADFNRGILVMDSVDPQIMPFLKGYLTFLKDYSPKVLCTELMLYSPTWGFCGTLDETLEIGNSIFLPDYKSSNQKLPSYDTQTMLYKILWEENDKRKIKERWLLQLTDDGKYNIVRLNDNSKDARGAIPCVIVYNLKVANGMTDDLDYTKEIFGY